MKYLIITVLLLAGCTNLNVKVHQYDPDGVYKEVDVSKTAWFNDQNVDNLTIITPSGYNISLGEYSGVTSEELAEFMEYLSNIAKALGGVPDININQKGKAK